MTDQREGFNMTGQRLHIPDTNLNTDRLGGDSERIMQSFNFSEEERHNRHAMFIKDLTAM